MRSSFHPSVGTAANFWTSIACLEFDGIEHQQRFNRDFP